MNIEDGKQENLQLQLSIRPYIKKFLFPVPALITFGESIKKNFIFYFIDFDVFGTTIDTIDCFLVKADPFTIYFYDRNTFHMICEKCRIILVSIISI